MSFPFNIVNHGDTVNVTAFIGNKMYVADSNHPAITDIVSLVTEGNADVVHLFDATESVTRRLRNHTDRVTLDAGRVLFDGVEVDNSISRAILRIAQTGQSYRGLVNFLGRIMENPNEHSKSQLFDWLRDRDFTITEDGCFIAYKGLNKDGGSISRGPGVVDGVAMNGSLPNKPGSVISMAREKVQHDSHIGCSVGLHVGTWDYASNFGYGVTAKIKVDPADVVSVPTDCSAQKMRVCRYEVVEYIDAPVAGVYDEELYDEELEDTYTSEDSLDDPWETEAVGGEFAVADEWEHDGWCSFYTIQKWENGDEYYLSCSCPAYFYARGEDAAKSCKHTESY